MFAFNAGKKLPIIAELCISEIRKLQLGSPAVHLLTFTTCRALRPRECDVSLPSIDIHRVVFGNSDALDHSSLPLTRLNHFNLTVYSL